MKTKAFTKGLARTALAAALICVCGWITVPTAVPFTMQTFGIFLSLKLLGGKKGTAAVLIYILLGAVGLPVFSGFQSGVGVLLGPTGGYIGGFLLCGLVYWATERRWRARCRLSGEAPALWRWLSDGTLLVGLGLCYLFGALWYTLLSVKADAALSFGAALRLCVLPFLLPDGLKLVLADAAARRLSRFVNGVQGAQSGVYEK